MPEALETTEVVETSEPKTVDPKVEAEARELGWVPEKDFRGDKTRWVDAESFVRRGHEIMPILRQNNSRLLNEVNSLKEQLRESTAAIEDLRKVSSEITRARVAEAKREVLAGIRAAREAGDVEVEDRLTDQLSELKQAETAAKAPAPAPKPTAEAEVDPAFTAWAARPENSWFGRDRRKTSLAMGIAQELRDDPSNSHLRGEAFYRAVADEVDHVLTGGPPPTNKVEGSRGGAGGNGGSTGRGKTYNDLPADAKAVCDKQASRFVGKGFKDTDAWRKHYTSIYFADEA